MIVVPLFALQGGSSASPPAFDVALRAVPVPSTWLEPSRIVLDDGRAGAPVASPTTLAAPGKRAVATSMRSDATPPSSPPTTDGPATSGPTTTGGPTTTAASGKAAAGPGPTTTTTAVLRLPVSLPINLSPVAPAQKPYTHVQRGVASWFNAADRTCAHTSIPFGTTVHVRRVSTGETTTCVVDDWGPADTSRIIDLSMDTFEQLAHAGEGLIEVVIEW